MARTAGSTSFITVPFATLQAEIAAGHVPDMVIVGKTWWVDLQVKKIEAGGIAPVTYQAPAAVSAKGEPVEELKEDNTPLDIV